MTVSKLQGIDKDDFSSLKEARAAQIDKEFDAMPDNAKIASNKELADLAKEKNKSEQKIKEGFQGEEAAEVAHTFLSMDDAGLKAFLENFRGKQSFESMAGSKTKPQEGFAMYHIAVQVLCKRLSFDPGPIDGVYGMNTATGTRKAVIDLQKKLNITPADGLLGPVTLAKVLDKWDDIINSKETEEGKEKQLNDAKEKLKAAFPDIDLSQATEWTSGCAGDNIILVGSYGDVWYGDREDGKQDGLGYAIRADGAKYKGNLVDNNRTGKGTCTRANGDTYEGDWVDNNRTGKGTYTRANGDTYKGDFYMGAIVDRLENGLIADIAKNYDNWKVYFGSQKSPIDVFSLDVEKNTLTLDIDQVGTDLGSNDEYVINLKKSDISSSDNAFTESFYSKLKQVLKERNEKKEKDESLKSSVLGSKI